MKSLAVKAGLVGVAAAATLAIAPVANAATGTTAEPRSTTPPVRTYPMTDAGQRQCEADAAVIRDGSTGAWCEPYVTPVTIYMGLYTTDM